MKVSHTRIISWDPLKTLWDVNYSYVHLGGEEAVLPVERLSSRLELLVHSRRAPEDTIPFPLCILAACDEEGDGGVGPWGVERVTFTAMNHTPSHTFYLGLPHIPGLFSTYNPPRTE